MGRVVVDPSQKCCGTCEFWSCGNTLKKVREGIECFPLGGTCKNLSISRNKTCRATDGTNCAKWKKNTNL